MDPDTGAPTGDLPLPSEHDPVDSAVEGPSSSFGPVLDEREQQIDADYEWCLHDPEVQRRYAGQVVVAYRGRIWGAGKNHREAGLAAEQVPGCPLKEYVATVYIEGVPLPARPR